MARGRCAGSGEIVGIVVPAVEGKNWLKNWELKVQSILLLAKTRRGFDWEKMGR
jgi:hypothetical protein